MADSAGQRASGAADADAELSWHGSPVLTYEIVGLSDIVVPHGHLQGLFGEVCIFYVVTELLQKIEIQKISSSFFLTITYLIFSDHCPV